MAAIRKPSKEVSTRKAKVTQSKVSVQKVSARQKVSSGAAHLLKKVSFRMRNLISRRPHRSFRLTRRRDYARSLRLPGYWSFTNQVRKTLWRHKKIFSFLAVIYSVFTIALVGIASQDVYSELSNTIRTTSGELFQGNMGEIGKAGIMLLAGATGLTGVESTTAQQIYAALLVLLVWLTTVWLLRAIMTGGSPRLRDGLYNAGSPIVSTSLVGLVFALQLLPIALAFVGFSAASATGLLEGGIEAMLFWTCALLLGALSLYWITSTSIALVVVTLPGMYPMQAIKAAGDLVIGRRIRILLRILWLFLMLAVIWLVIMIPIILFDTWLKGIWSVIEWIPVVPVALLIMSTLTVIWSASYVYMLYRKVVDDDAAPA